MEIEAVQHEINSVANGEPQKWKQSSDSPSLHKLRKIESVAILR